MNKGNVKLLESLIKIPSPSGLENGISQFILNEIKGLKKVNAYIDHQKNVIAEVKGTSDTTVMIDAHADTIGFIVSNVNKYGMISLQYIGGGCYSILSARHLLILTEKGVINAVVDRKHAHLIYNERDEDITSMSDVFVDIGIRERNEVSKIVKIGDPVVYRPSFNQLVGDYYAGYGFDDKAGCYILLETLKAISKSKKRPPANLVFVFSAQEETGGSKLRPVARKYNPDLIVGLDVTFATDYQQVLEEEVGRCILGKGLVIYRGVDLYTKAIEDMEYCAKKHKLPIQYQACSGRIGYNSVSMTNLCNGIRAMILGIPLRNMHAPAEIISMKDLISGTKLLTNFLLRK